MWAVGREVGGGTVIPSGTGCSPLTVIPLNKTLGEAHLWLPGFPQAGQIPKGSLQSQLIQLIISHMYDLTNISLFMIFLLGKIFRADTKENTVYFAIKYTWQLGQDLSVMLRLQIVNEEL